MLRSFVSLKMGKAPTWSAAEAATVAQSWIAVSEDGVEANGQLSGSDQNSNEFWAKIVINIQTAAPIDAMRERVGFTTED